jgi:hypothetical protein
MAVSKTQCEHVTDPDSDSDVGYHMNLFMIEGGDFDKESLVGGLPSGEVVVP